MSDPWDPLDQQMGFFEQGGEWGMRGWGRRTGKRLSSWNCLCRLLGVWETVSSTREVQKSSLLCFQFIPESARFNVSTGNTGAALATLHRIASMNGVAVPQGQLREPPKVSPGCPAHPSQVSGLQGGRGTAYRILLCPPCLALF